MSYQRVELYCLLIFHKATIQRVVAVAAFSMCSAKKLHAPESRGSVFFQLFHRLFVSSHTILNDIN